MQNTDTRQQAQELTTEERAVVDALKECERATDRLDDVMADLIAKHPTDDEGLGRSYSRCRRLAATKGDTPPEAALRGHNSRAAMSVAVFASIDGAVAWVLSYVDDQLRRAGATNRRRKMASQRIELGFMDQFSSRLNAAVDKAEGSP